MQRHFQANIPLFKISKKSDYAIVSLASIAKADKIVSAKKIAEEHNFSPMMISKVLKELVQGGLLIGTRGVTGGYSLRMKLENITLGHILEVMDGPLEIISCCSAIHDCPAAKNCKVKYSMNKVHYKIKHVLEGITLKELLKTDNEGEL